jgi:hypothetical protein
MAKVYGPLGGTMASGALGKAVVYGNWRGIAWARAYRVPQNPRTPAQQALRAVHALAVATWKGLAAKIKGSYNVMAEVARASTGVGGKAATKMSGYNLFVGLFRRATRYPMEGFVCDLVVNPDSSLTFGVTPGPASFPPNVQVHYSAKPWGKWQRATGVYSGAGAIYNVPAPYVDLPVGVAPDDLAVIVDAVNNTTGAKVFLVGNFTDGKLVENMVCP